MNRQTLCLLAHFKARPEKAADLRALLLGLIPPTRMEPGCLRYELWDNEDDPTELTFVEEWESAEALDRHLETPHLQAALGRFPELLAEELVLRRYRKAA